MAGKVVATSFTNATQQILTRPRLATRLDHVVTSNPNAAIAYLHVWVTKTSPTLPLGVATRHDKIPIAASQPTTTIPLHACEGAFVTVSITTGEDATGDIALDQHCSFRWE